MPRLRALTSSADRKAGDEFDADETDARILCAPDLPGGPKAEYADRSMRPAPPTESTPANDEKPDKSDKRRYMRRDLRAQN